jgi:uncharacterized protein (DUF2252 family)
MKSLPAFLCVIAYCCLLQAQAPFDRIEKAYSPYMDAEDPLAFPMKVKSLAADPYKFWRGSKDLFYFWCKSNTSDWMSDKSTFLANHGDLHLGNIGTYAAEGEFGELAFGMVDFDDSGRLPFQFELLQGLITLRLTAEQNKIDLLQEQKSELTQALIDTYHTSVNSRRNATDLLADDAWARKLLDKGRKHEYADELKDYLGADGKFLPAMYSKGKLKEILRPADERVEDFATAISQAMKNSPEMAKLFRYSRPEDIRKAIQSTAQRTRLGSSGSQGLKKYFILLDKPLIGIDSPIILYLKQEIPCAAERQGLIPRESRPPGERCADDMNHLTEPRPYFNSWCTIEDESYWVHFKEPWSNELDPADVTGFTALIAAAKIWGTVAGATHREEGRFEMILPHLTPALVAQIEQRTDAYLTRLQADFSAFQSDPRVAEWVHKADEEIELLAGKP